MHRAPFQTVSRSNLDARIGAAGALAVWALVYGATHLALAGFAESIISRAIAVGAALWTGGKLFAIMRHGFSLDVRPWFLAIAFSIFAVISRALTESARRTEGLEFLLEMALLIETMAGVAATISFVWCRSATKSLALGTSLLVSSISVAVFLHANVHLFSPSTVFIHGRAIRHPVLDYVFQPYTVFCNGYLSNPANNFERWPANEVMFLDHWRLDSHNAASAVATLPTPFDPNGARVEYMRPGNASADVVLRYGSFDLRGAADYTLDFQVCAERATGVSFQIESAEVGNRRLAGPFHFESSERPRRVRVQFRPSVTARANVVFFLGDQDQQLVFSQMHLASGGSAPNWTTIYPRFLTDFRVTYALNANGFRGPDRAQVRPSNVLRIACLGDSFCFGIGVHDADLLTTQLEERLNRRFSADPHWDRVEVLNFGMPGYDTRHERLLYEHVASQYGAQIVLLLMCRNDDYLTMNFAGKNPVEPQRDFRRCADEIELLEKSCAAHSARLAVIAFRHESFDRAPDWRPLVTLLAPIMKRKGIPWIDLGEQLLLRHAEESMVVHPTDSHPNHVAHRAAAAIIENFLVAQDLFGGLVPHAPLAIAPAGVGSTVTTSVKTTSSFGGTTTTN